ncbi:hypothetical protein HanRHA438_Chr06g0269341 [Helianthus annuus]|uniref:Uncharacterized protein n=1 Tax=Helianthus annuus TaxID=4232 RepID=A0A9K3ITK0_HELAN|nr:hypothetical protein HanXRQr2_Chr06g0260371 [Helianthus annuus]KAJ0560626.1 hypothetical protein HanHA300_Chr06g0213461 [Helianthus annuus]KAJ0573662.1 hypothetical protein HanHA89_Chr06g0229231 [Helianthus annuus]KAJ0740899.1 hypothetical protein HanOQP8_Chr06g0221881 [Helianthus annuus]KAJ0911995.1 hypothetical protein HanRHA438_Chr06g0269341 [Helianthus annuus]
MGDLKVIFNNHNLRDLNRVSATISKLRKACQNSLVEALQKIQEGLLVGDRTYVELYEDPYVEVEPIVRLVYNPQLWEHNLKR